MNTLAGDNKASLDAGNGRRARSPKDTPRARRPTSHATDLARIVAAYRRIRHDLIGRPATVIGRPEIDGHVIAVSLNPHGVVVVTLKARDLGKPRKPRAKAFPLRLRLAAEACTYGERASPPARRKHVPAPRQFKRPEPIALDHQGRLVVA